jgi:hypothetical protein
MITYDELNKECEFWRNAYHTSMSGEVFDALTDHERARIVWIALAAAKARMFQKPDEELINISNQI